MQTGWTDTDLAAYGMGVIRHPLIPFALGALLIGGLAAAGAKSTGPEMVGSMASQAETAISEAGGTGITARFSTAGGALSRHPMLSGGEGLNENVRDRVAKAVARIPGVNGVYWSDSTGLAASKVQAPRPLHCQDDVDALLRARSIRFEESSARIDATSLGLVNEVAQALRPCLGSIIAITGHTDSSGPEPGNLALSQERSEAVRRALISRGIPSDGLRARGVGSAEPVNGLDPGDPANRRIEFSVIASVPIKPTPVDTPGPR